MWPHFINLLHRAWNAMTGSTSTNTLGFILWTIALTAVLWLAAVGANWWKRRKEVGAFREAFAGSLVSGIFSAIGVTFLVLAVLGWFTVRTIYDDHQWQMGRKQELEKKVPARENEIQNLKSKLEATCYRPDRHLTPELEKVLFVALSNIKDKLSASQRHIAIGGFHDDKESFRFAMELWALFRKAGWNVPDYLIWRNIPLKAGGLLIPGQSNEGITISETASGNTSEWREQDKVLGEIIIAFQGVNLPLKQGLINDSDPLKKTKGLILFVGAKPDGP